MPIFTFHSSQNPDKLALYIQGIKYHKSNMRQDILFDPNTVIKNSVDECFALIATKKESQQRLTKQRNDRISKRLQHKVELALPYIMYHKIVKLFNFAEVSDLNTSRSKDDQLELMFGGLLKHHCCYIDCPQYLTNFETEYDKKYGTRYGIMKHLDHNRYINNYVKSFHKLAKSFAGYKFDKFVEKMNEHFKDDPNYINKINLDLDLRGAWNSYNK